MNFLFILIVAEIILLGLMTYELNKSRNKC